MTGYNSHRKELPKSQLRWTGCLTTGKRGYDSRAEAKLVLRRWDDAKGADLAVYRCDDCGLHHIGTQGGHSREQHRAWHEGIETREWVPIRDVVAALKPDRPAKMRHVLHRLIDAGHIHAEEVLGEWFVHRDEIPRLRIAAHDRAQDYRLKGL